MKVEVTKEQIVCDRCGRRIAKQRESVSLTNGGITQSVVQAEDTNTKLDLCLPCESSLKKWWERPRGES